MRDLASRLRQIVKNDLGGHFSELTYSAEASVSLDADEVAARLGGRVHRHGASACAVVDRVWEADDYHGRRRVGAYLADAAAPIGLFAPDVSLDPGWARRVVYFDLETTGLSGGAGTLPFLAGCGWFEGDAFRVRQFFLGGPAGEPALLAALGAIFREASLIVTFNGRTFDLPLMETRWAFHRQPSPVEDCAHFDMLPPARRLWRFRPTSSMVTAGAIGAGRALGAGDDEEKRSCRLSALEQSIIGFHRLDDVPGIEIPARYFHFLRTGEASAVAGVLEHNQHDLISLAAVMSHALSLAADGPEGCREACEQFGLGHYYEQAGEGARALRAYELAAAQGEGEVRRQALARLATLARREARHEDAAAAWAQVFDAGAAGVAAGRVLSPIERRAAEALAIHHEHRAADPETARRYAEALRRATSGRGRQDAEHRLGRLAKKIAKKKEAGVDPRVRMFD